MKTKNIILIVALVLIIGTIAYLQAKKPQQFSTKDAEKIAVTEQSAMSDDSQSMMEATTSATSSQKVSIKSDRSVALAAKAKLYPSAIELIPGGKFINSDPFTLKS